MSAGSAQPPKPGAVVRGRRWSFLRWADLPLSWKGAVVVAIPMAVLAVNWGSLLYLTQAQQSDRVAAVQAADATQSGQQVLVALLDAETGVRGYLLSHQQSFLAPYQTAVAELPGLLSTLRQDAGRHSERVAPELTRLGALARRELSTLALLRTRAGAPLSELQPYLELGKSTMDQARTTISALVASEKARVAAHDQALAEANLGVLVVLIATVPLGVAGGALAMWLFTRGVGRRIAAVQRTAEALPAGVMPPLTPSEGDEVGQLAQAIRGVGTLLVERQEAARESALAAESANRAKTDFLSRMSHELRTPLNAILGFGQLLELEPRSADDQESVDQILKAGRHLLELINEILDLSRIESGRMTLSIEPVDVSEVVAESVHLLAPTASQRGCTLDLDLKEETILALADRQRLKQVMLNLLSNAVKYNRAGGSASVRVGYSESGGVLIEVSDTGIGIAPELLGRMFSPFDRLGQESSEVGGTGLGLALSKSLVEAMNGSIRVSSQPGVGTKFSVELERAPAAQAGPGVKPEGAGATAPSTAQGTVLYIEDNLSNLKLVERLLRHRPQVLLLPAMQGGLGLELAHQHAPRLVLLDRHLPDIDGAEVLRRLRVDPATATSAIYVLTADASPGQRQRLLAAGADGYLTKPIDVDQFLALLDRALGGLGSDQPAAPGLPPEVVGTAPETPTGEPRP